MDEKKELLVELTREELAQIYMSLISRSALVTMEWTNCADSNRSKFLEELLQYLNDLTFKIRKYLPNENQESQEAN